MAYVSGQIAPMSQQRRRKTAEKSAPPGAVPEAPPTEAEEPPNSERLFFQLPNFTLGSVLWPAPGWPSPEDPPPADDPISSPLPPDLAPAKKRRPRSRES